MNKTQSTDIVVGWVIDRDYLVARYGGDSQVGKGMTVQDRQEGEDASFFRKVINVRRGLKPSTVVDGVRFRMLDDDDEIYYGGVIAREWLEGGEEFAFAAQEWAEADSGCTQFQYREGDKDWRTL